MHDCWPPGCERLQAEAGGEDLMVVLKGLSGSRSARVAMLLASMAGSIGMGVPLLPVAELANPVNRPGNPTWGDDQAQQPHAVVVWGSADPRRRQQRESVSVMEARIDPACFRCGRVASGAIVARGWRLD